MAASCRMSSGSLLESSDIKVRARELGFDACGIAPAADHPELTFFRDWLGRGFAGGMQYLHRSAERRSCSKLVGKHAARVVPTSNA